MGKRERLSGNEAVAIALRQINPDVFPAFPITPSTEIPQYFSTFVANGTNWNIKYEVNGEVKEGRFSFIFITNSSRIGGVDNIYDDVKLNDNKFEVLMCDIKNKFDMLRKKVDNS